MKALMYNVFGCIVEFICMYVPLHLLFFYVNYENGECFTVFMLIISSLLGIGVAIVSQKAHKGKNSIILFTTFYLFFLGISAILFYGAPYQGWLEKVFYCFPQMLVVAFMIPGAICYIILKSFFLLKSSHKEHIQ